MPRPFCRAGIREATDHGGLKILRGNEVLSSNFFSAMKIAQVSPLFESVPPVKYGGTERVVSYLTEELVAQDHDVTLFASGDSVTSAKLEPCCERSLRLDRECQDPVAWHIVQLEKVARQFHEFDVVHFHADYLHLTFSTRMKTPSVSTLHGRLDMAELAALYHMFEDAPLISISNAQRTPIPGVNWLATVYHGLPEDLFRLEDDPEEYLAVVGRVSPEKGIDRAIEIAIKADMPLRIAAKISKVDEAYFHEKIAPLLKHPLVEFIGEVNDQEKQEVIGKAKALLFPIDWPEPFGLAMIEAMACGTPVIAFRRGSVPEVMNDGLTGYIVDNVDQAVCALRRLGAVSRRCCRETFLRRFTAYRMTSDYVREYERLLS
jgi:glycosyltransferase involved in cell wall biosynthesis